MASTSSFNASDDILQGQKAGGEKLPGTPETAFTQQKSPPAIKQTGGTTAKVSTFTPTAEQAAAQQYETVGAKGRQPGMQTLASKERTIASGVEKAAAKAPIQAPELQASMQRGIEPRSKLTLASQPAEFKMSGTRPGYENIPKQSAGIFKPRPSSVTPMAVPVGEPYVKSQSRALAVIPQPKPEPTFTEKMAQGAKYAPPKVEPSMAEKMAGSAKYSPPKIDPYTGEVIKEGASVGSKVASAGRGILDAAKGTAKSVLRPLLAANPIVDAAMAQQANEASMGRNVQRMASGQDKYGTLAQEAALQFMRDPTMAIKALGSATGGKIATESDVFKSAPMANNMTQKTETAEKAFPVGTSLPGGGTAGDKEPEIDMPKPTINAKVEAPVEKPKPEPVVMSLDKPQYSREEINAFAQPKAGQSGLQQAVSRGSGGNFRYVQSDKGELIKQNLDTGELKLIGMAPSKEQQAEAEARRDKFVSEYNARKASEKEEAFRNALLQMAQSQGDGSFTGMGQAKRDRKMAQFLLGQLNAQQQAGAQNALEREKMGITERNTAATLEQNRLAKAADQALKQKQIDVAQEGNEIRRQALEGKSAKRTYMIGDRPVQMTPEEHRDYARSAQKEQFLRKNKDNEDASAQYSRYELARKQVDAALADPKNADKRDAIIAAYEEETGLDYIE